jgi:hypothetical protein
LPFSQDPFEICDCGFDPTYFARKHCRLGLPLHSCNAGRLGLRTELRAAIGASFAIIDAEQRAALAAAARADHSRAA